MHDLSLSIDKLFAHAVKCIFLVYSRVRKVYRCYSPFTDRFYISADVTFEDTPYFTSSVAPEPISQVLRVSILFHLSLTLQFQMHQMRQAVLLHPYLPLQVLSLPATSASSGSLDEVVVTDFGDSSLALTSQPSTNLPKSPTTHQGYQWRMADGGL